MAFTSAGFGDFLARVQSKLEEFFVGALVLDGVEYGVACGGGDKDGAHQSGGMLEEMGQLVRLRKSVYPDEPVLGARVTLNGVAGRIVSVSDRLFSDSWSLRISPAR